MVFCLAVAEYKQQIFSSLHHLSFGCHNMDKQPMQENIERHNFAGYSQNPDIKGEHKQWF